MNGQCKVYRKIMEASSDITLSIVNLREFIDVIRSKKSIKFYFSIKPQYHQAKDPTDITDPPVVHNSNVYVFLTDDSEIENQIKLIHEKITSDMEVLKGTVVDGLWINCSRLI
uniref:Conserved uncharacterized protein n=1 Tax=Clytia hemisphaerica TaxID=252671 RepID=A0A069DMG6_9CNID